MAGLTVVGLGPGAAEYLTPAAAQAIDRADILVGGHRHLEMYRHLPVPRIPITADLKPLLHNIDQEVAAGKNVVVLASGDPGFYGILTTIKRELPHLKPRVVPGISSFQLACARLGITWEEACLTSCHGRDPGHLARLVKNHRLVITLTDRQHNPPALARALLEAGTGDLPVHVACNLSYPEELITSTTLEILAARTNWTSGSCVMVIVNET